MPPPGTLPLLVLMIMFMRLRLLPKNPRKGSSQHHVPELHHSAACLFPQDLVTLRFALLQDYQDPSHHRIYLAHLCKIYPPSLEMKLPYLIG